MCILCNVMGCILWVEALDVDDAPTNIEINMSQSQSVPLQNIDVATEKIIATVQDALQALPPKMLALSSTEPTLPVSLPEMSLDKRVAHVTERIQTATFTGKCDKPMVVQLYKDYLLVSEGPLLTLTQSSGSKNL